MTKDTHIVIISYLFNLEAALKIHFWVQHLTLKSEDKGHLNWTEYSF